MIDLHNHILSEIDDGAGSMEETIEMARIAVGEGITKIVVTPHHRKPNFLASKKEILENIEATNKVLKEENIGLKLFPGMEIHIDRDIPEKLQRGELLSLNDSKYLLIEFPMNEEPGYIEDVLHEVKIQGYKPIIAHPERYRSVIKDPNYVRRLIEIGCIFQINSNSLTGAFGEDSKRTVEILLKHKMVHLISTDSHSQNRRSPKIRQALKLIKDLTSEEYVDYMVDNADRVFNNEGIEIEKPVAYEARKSFLTKAKNLFNFKARTQRA